MTTNQVKEETDKDAISTTSSIIPLHRGQEKVLDLRELMKKAQTTEQLEEKEKVKNKEKGPDKQGTSSKP